MPLPPTEPSDLSNRPTEPKRMPSEIIDIQDEIGDVYIGMSIDDFHKLVPESECFRYGSYAFYTNSKGNYVVIRFLVVKAYGDGGIGEIKCYDSKLINPTPEKFDLIEERMSIFDVIALIGIPYDSTTFGAATLNFKDTNGDSYRIFLFQSQPDGLLTVERVTTLDI